jgi:hypothetical protein
VGHVIKRAFQDLFASAAPVPAPSSRRSSAVSGTPEHELKEASETVEVSEPSKGPEQVDWSKDERAAAMLRQVPCVACGFVGSQNSLATVSQNS